MLRGGSSGAGVSASQGGVSQRGASDHGQSHAGGLSRGKAAGGRASAPAGRTQRERSARRAGGAPTAGGKTEGPGIRFYIPTDFSSSPSAPTSNGWSGWIWARILELMNFSFSILRRSTPLGAFLSR